MSYAGNKVYISQYSYVFIVLLLIQYYLSIHSGHIQVSQVPDRNEPSSAGEISYQYIFKLLNDLGYNQWIGCEYTPQGIIILIFNQTNPTPPNPKL